MRVLGTMTAKGEWLVTLAIGTPLKVALCAESGWQDEQDKVYDAEVIEQLPDDAQAQVLVNIPSVPGGVVATLHYSDGESHRMVLDDDITGFFAVADRQPDHDDAAPAEPEPEPVEHEAVEDLPPARPVNTAITLNNLPRGPAWLLDEARLLDAEADKYRQFSPPHQSLTGAAAALRSAVGHVLAGGHEKDATKFEAF